MLETITILLFAIVLFICVLSNVSIVYALVTGYFIFFTYGLIKKNSISELFKMSISGVKTVKNILTIFLLIGMITAVWRVAGTIPIIIYYSSGLIIPAAFILVVFLLNCAVSVLIGTAFGTAATIGVICMTMATTIGINPIYVGGAILSGIYFGDRCSPMSGSANLVSGLTETSVFENIKEMAKTSLVPFVLTCVIYIFLGLTVKGKIDVTEIQEVFNSGFNLHWVAVLPAVAILLFSVFKVDVKLTMLCSIAIGIVISVTVQGNSIFETLKIMALGYNSTDANLAAMLNGGGVISMLNVMLIVCISSSYAGLFEGTGLLISLKNNIFKLSKKISPYGSTLFTAVFASMISCNQTLAIMITHQLCKDTVKDESDMAIYLENTAVLIPALVPWSIAVVVPMSAIAAPTVCLLASFYLYLVPLWNFVSIVRKNKLESRKSYNYSVVNS